jgi:hypothetical protein
MAVKKAKKLVAKKATAKHAKRKATTTKRKTTTARKTTAKRTTAKRATAKRKPAAKKTASTRKYSPIASQLVAKEMRKFKKGTATSGKGRTPVKSRSQAIAIGLSEARKKGAKVPTPKKK